MIDCLKEKINENGIMLLNESDELPSIVGEGFNWYEVMGLIEKGDIFFTKLYKKRTTYISRELYFCFKTILYLEHMTDSEHMLHNLINEISGITTSSLKEILIMDSKELDKLILQLSMNMQITILGSGKYININWSHVRWCTAEYWESLGISYKFTPNEAKEIIRKKFGKYLSSQYIERLIGRMERRI